jgi:hypothetical protein
MEGNEAEGSNVGDEDGRSVDGLPVGIKDG